MNSQVCIPVKLRIDGLEAEALNRLYADSNAATFDEFVKSIILSHIESYG